MKPILALGRHKSLKIKPKPVSNKTMRTILGFGMFPPHGALPSTSRTAIYAEALSIPLGIISPLCA